MHVSAADYVCLAPAPRLPRVTHSAFESVPLCPQWRALLLLAHYLNRNITEITSTLLLLYAQCHVKTTAMPTVSSVLF